MSHKTVAILGCGPAGLLAALAAEQCGYDVVIYSDKKKSEIHGAQVLHVAIPGLTSIWPDKTIDIVKFGTKGGYATKVYGNPDAPVSWDAYDGKLDVWSMRDAYDLLWQAFKPSIQDVHIDRTVAEKICKDFDRVVSSVPLPAIAPEGHYAWQNVWVVSNKASPEAKDKIIWSGDPDVPWYRASILFGHFDREYATPSHLRPGVKLQKPLGSTGTTDVLPKMLRVGRYGEFRKGVLIHDAYDNTKEHLAR